MPSHPEDEEVTLGWSDRIAKIRKRMEDRYGPRYYDQGSHDVLVCVNCQYWRATHGDLCEMCSFEMLRNTMED